MVMFEVLCMKTVARDRPLNSNLVARVLYDIFSAFFSQMVILVNVITSPAEAMQRAAVENWATYQYFFFPVEK